MQLERRNELKLKKLIEKGVHFEETREFEESIFSDIYSNAVDNVQKIVAYNRERKQNSIQFVKQKAISNVISFIGRRGTGKTSAMISFSNALNTYNGQNMMREERNIKFDPEANMKDVRFFSLECIEASSLEESENVFILVLANMLDFLKKGEDVGTDELSVYKQRSLLKKFEGLYDDFVTLKESKQYERDAYSSYEKLMNISSSRKIRLNFSQLVREFLLYLTEKEENVFLVISIDDLDMANYNQCDVNRRQMSNKSYEIMNSIYKYLTVPGVIVLSAYNHVNLHKQCVNFFVSDDLIEQDIQRESSKKLAAQFMDKVLSPVFRIYMPSWKKRDFEETQFKIDIGEETVGNDVFNKFRKKRGKIFSVKDFLLILFGEITGVYYDYMGKKKHFLEPESLRALNNIVCLVADSDGSPKMDYIAMPSEKQKQAVFRRIKNDIYFRFAQERLLSIKERYLFDQWQAQRIDRRSESIVDLLCKEIQPLGLRNKKRLEQYELQKKDIANRGITENESLILQRVISDVSDNSKVRYSYAELVHCIYHMSRTGTKYSKELVACILHSYSIYLTQIYDSYIREKRIIDKKDYIENFCNKLDNKDNHIATVNGYYTILKNVIGETIFGKWTEYYYPVINTRNTSPDTDTYNRIPVILGYAEKMDVKWNLQANKEIPILLDEILYLSMLYVNVFEWEELVIEYIVDNIDNKVINLVIKVEKESDLELTGFLKYTFLYPDYLVKMKELLVKAFSVENDGSNATGKFKKTVFDYLPEYFEKLWNDFYEWDKKYGNMMIPIQNFDLVYNMIKRLFQEKEKMQDEINISNKKMRENNSVFLSEFKEMTEKFADYLGEIDKYYCLEDEKWNFKQSFLECPYIGILNNLCESYGDDIGNNIRKIIMDINDKENLLVIGADEK